MSEEIFFYIWNSHSSSFFFLSKSDVKTSNKTNHHLVKYEQAIEVIESQIRNEFSTIDERNTVEFYERMLHVAGAKIVFYMHGNSGSRAASHRIELYQVLREQGYHVIAFDYRGYGDSLPPSPTETGLVNDAIAVYKYITSVTKNPIAAWGHSLGKSNRRFDEHILSLIFQFYLMSFLFFSF